MTMFRITLPGIDSWLESEATAFNSIRHFSGIHSRLRCTISAPAWGSQVWRGGEAVGWDR